MLVSGGQVAFGMTNTTSFLRPASAGATLRAVAEPLHRGRTTWLVDVAIRDENDRLCATSRGDARGPAAAGAAAGGVRRLAQDPQPGVLLIAAAAAGGQQPDQRRDEDHADRGGDD